MINPPIGSNHTIGDNCSTVEIDFINEVSLFSRLMHFNIFCEGVAPL
jgi:hypothetical protein